MVVRGLEVLFEYIGIMMCIYRVAQKKFSMNIELCAILILDVFVNRLVEQQIIAGYFKIVIYVCIYIYIRKQLELNWKKTIEVYAIAFISILFLQLFVYFLFKFLTLNVITTKYGGILVNIVVCMLVGVWNNKFWMYVANKINVSREVILAILIISIFFSFLWIYNQGTFVNFGMALQFLLETIGITLVSVFWIAAEKENKHKVEEIQMYKSYTEAFEEAIKTIRTRQHEFENHINAIRCMQFTIKDRETLIQAQEKYCENVIKENIFNKLLSIELEPILIGFLYSKFTKAYEKGIVTRYQIESVSLEKYIKIYELIELIGILYDNAVEALEDDKLQKCILFRIKEDEKNTYIEIANASILYKNSEIERFCTYGYSTKKNHTGLGLVRAKEIISKYNAILQIQNLSYNGEYYLSFQVVFSK